MQESLRAAQFNASALPNILHQKIQVITLLLYIYASSFMIARNINPTLFDLSGRKVLVPQKEQINKMGNKKDEWKERVFRIKYNKSRSL